MGPPEVMSAGSASGLRPPSRSWMVCTGPGASPALSRTAGTCPSPRWPTPTCPPSSERGHQEGAESPQQEGEARRGEDQPSEEHPHHAPAQPLCRRAEKERRAYRRQEPEG